MSGSGQQHFVLPGPGKFLSATAGVAGPFPSHGLVTKEQVQVPGQQVGVGWPEVQRRVPSRLPDAAAFGDDRRQTSGHPFKSRHPERLVPARRYTEDRRLAVLSRDAGAVDERDKCDAVSQRGGHLSK
jgi:hypothetical protein